MASSKHRENFVYIAKLQGRPNDTTMCTICTKLVEAMTKVADLGVELTVGNRNLLSVSYKNADGSRRAAWKLLLLIEQKEDSKGIEVHVKRIRDYRQKVEAELSSICVDI